jgi:hypothetical protein
MPDAVTPRRKPHSPVPGYICERRGNTADTRRGHYAIFDGTITGHGADHKWVVLWIGEGVSVPDATVIRSFPSCNKARAFFRTLFTSTPTTETAS